MSKDLSRDLARYALCKHRGGGFKCSAHSAGPMGPSVLVSLFFLFLESVWPLYCCLSKLCGYVQVCMFARVLSLRTTAVCKYGSTLDNFSRLSFRLGPPKRHFGIIWGIFRHGGADPGARCPPERHLEAQNELTGPSRSAVGAKRDGPRGPNGAKS